jgi:hypothetical protein
VIDWKSFRALNTPWSGRDKALRTGGAMKNSEDIYLNGCARSPKVRRQGP